jgi:predicted  nucleic acid-binding Zn-ribbon protein
MNPQYEAHERLCKSIGAMAKENEDLKQHVTELENRLRALWDKLEGESKYYMEQIRRLEEERDAMMADLLLWRKAKEAKL